MEKLGQFSSNAVPNRRGVLLAETETCAAASNSAGVRIHPPPLHCVSPGVIHAPFSGEFQTLMVNFRILTVQQPHVGLFSGVTGGRAWLQR